MVTKLQAGRSGVRIPAGAKKLSFLQNDVSMTTKPVSTAEVK
jgi:hypothetical protein